jgi:hypothetical protein
MKKALLVGVVLSLVAPSTKAQDLPPLPGPPVPAEVPPPPSPEKLPAPPEIPPSAMTNPALPAITQPLGPMSGGPLGMLLGKNVGQMPVFATYKVTWFPDEEVRGQPTNLGYHQHDFSLAAPVWQDPFNEWSVNTHVRGEFFHTGAVLPQSGMPFPDELWNVHFGTTYRHLFENDWIAGVSASLGSNSNKPFHGIDEMFVGMNAFVRIPSFERNAWLLTLNYSPTNELNFPIPGVAYVWNPNDSFLVNIGLPFMVFYRPTDDLTLDLSYMLVRTVHARATYRLAPPLRVHVAFDWMNENYFLADRANVNDRFFYYDKRATTGVQYVLSSHTALDLSGGYVFDRFYFQGARFSGDSHNDRIDVGNGAFVSLQFQMRW